MKLLFIVLIMIVSSTIQAQVKVEGIDINSLSDIKYVEIVGAFKFMSTKVTVYIDYGQKLKLGTDQRIENETGKPMVFNSMVDALNFMEANGWVFVNNYAITSGQQNVYHFLLKRRE
jgi:hypothetical protein